MSAVLGSLVGGSATMATAWITQRISTKRELIREELRRREALYGEFISECSRLAIDSLAHGIEEPEKMWSAYACSTASDFQRPRQCSRRRKRF